MAGKCDFQAQCVVPFMFKSSQANLRVKLRSVEVQTEVTRRKVQKRIHSKGPSGEDSGDQVSGGHHFGVP